MEAIIDDVAKEYANRLCSSNNETHRGTDVNIYIENAFKDGVLFAEEWIDFNDEIPVYFQVVFAIFLIDTIELPISVWRAWCEVSGEIYMITGTNQIVNGKPIKWRPINK
jgi:hypothetical protein